MIIVEKRNKQCFFDIETERKIIQDYKKGEGGATYLKNKYKANSEATIYRILRAYGVPRRSLSEARRAACKYEIDEKAFENIDTREKAYWLGIMYTDGYICKAQEYTNYVGLSISEKDIDLLEKFKVFLKYSGEIKHYKVSSGYKIGTPYVRLRIGNNKLVADLEKWGVVEHKTKIINGMPDIPYKMDFIRGVIDGDGSLYKRLPNIRICGNYDFLLSIAEYLQLPYRIRPDRSIWDLCYNTQESRYLEKVLYKDAPVYLNRKYEIAKRSFNSPITLEDVKEKK